MFAAGELVVYGGECVCRVEKIGPAAVPGADKTKLYYTLLPLYRTGQVLTPVDTKVLMRPALTQQEAQTLVETLSTCDVPEIPAGNPRVLKEHYQAVVTSYDCAAVARLIRQLARRRACAAAHGKKPSQLDERYLKRAEDQLYGELGAALGIGRDQAADYIRKYCPAWPEV